MPLPPSVIDVLNKSTPSVSSLQPTEIGDGESQGGAMSRILEGVDKISNYGIFDELGPVAGSLYSIGVMLGGDKGQSLLAIAGQQVESKRSSALTKLLMQYGPQAGFDVKLQQDQGKLSAVLTPKEGMGVSLPGLMEFGSAINSMGGKSNFTISQSGGASMNFTLPQPYSSIGFQSFQEAEEFAKLGESKGFVVRAIDQDEEGSWKVSFSGRPEIKEETIPSPTDLAVRAAIERAGPGASSEKTLEEYNKLRLEQEIAAIKRSQAVRGVVHELPGGTQFIQWFNADGLPVHQTPQNIGKSPQEQMEALALILSGFKRDGDLDNRDEAFRTQARQPGGYSFEISPGATNAPSQSGFTLPPGWEENNLGVGDWRTVPNK